MDHEDDGSKNNINSIKQKPSSLRKHKKGQEEEQSKRKTRRTQELQKAIVGASLSDILAKRNMKPEVRKAQREQRETAIKTAKEAKKAAKEPAKKPVMEENDNVIHKTQSTVSLGEEDDTRVRKQYAMFGLSTGDGQEVRATCRRGKLTKFALVGAQDDVGIQGRGRVESGVLQITSGQVQQRKLGGRFEITPSPPVLNELNVSIAVKQVEELPGVFAAGKLVTSRPNRGCHPVSKKMLLNLVRRVGRVLG